MDSSPSCPFQALWETCAVAPRQCGALAPREQPVPATHNTEATTLASALRAMAFTRFRWQAGCGWAMCMMNQPGQST